MKTLSIFFIFSLFAIKSFADLNIYSDRKLTYLQSAITAYEEKTGDVVNFITMDSSELIQRLSQEGEFSPADLIYVKDMVYLERLSQKELLQPMKTQSAKSKVKDFMRSPDNMWTAINYRARTLVYNKNSIDPKEISNYEDLGLESFKGKLCLSSSKETYNEAMVSNFIANRGYEKTKAMMASWLKNLALPVIASDYALLSSVASGDCPLGIVNSYYLGFRLSRDPNFPVGIKFLDQGEKALGAHINGTGAGVAAFSQNPEGANLFIDMMLEENLQHQLASSFQYTADTSLQPKSLIQNWGVFKANSTPWYEIMSHELEAQRLFEEIGY